MVRENFQPLQECVFPGKYLINEVEGRLKDRENHASLFNRYRAYFEGLGGQLITSMPPAVDTRGIALSYSPLNERGLFQPVDATRPFKATIIHEYLLADILAQNPQFPDFWSRVADGGKIPYVVYIQERQAGDVAIPKTLIELKDESLVRMRFLHPDSTLILYPHCLAEDTFSFDRVPIVVDRAWRVGINVRETKKLPFAYFSIEYSQNEPNRMKPVFE